MLLITRSVNLNNNPSSKNNNYSLSNEFSTFIKNLCLKLKHRVYIDYALFKGEIVAIGLNFFHSLNNLYYLRCHIKKGNTFSFGLMLDYWSITTNKEASFKTFDFTRGDESYKYRLGTIEYKTANYKEL